METTFPSPSGRFEVRTSPWEVRMSLWIETPKVVDTVAGETVLSFRDNHWSLDGADWVSENVVELWLRKYPGGHVPTGVRVALDCAGRTARLGDALLPLREVERALDRSLTWPEPPAPPAPQGLAGLLRRLYKLWRGGR